MQYKNKKKYIEKNVRGDIAEIVVIIIVVYTILMTIFKLLFYTRQTHDVKKLL